MRAYFALGALVLVGCGSSSDASSAADAGASDASIGADASAADGASASDASIDSAVSDSGDAGTTGDAAARCTPTPWKTEQLEAVGEAPSLAVDANGAIHVAFTTGFHGNVMYGHRAPGGAWATEIVSTGQATSNTAIAVDANGGVHIVFQTDTGTSDALQYAYRPSSGGWTTELVHAPVNIGADQIVSIAIDALGKPQLGIEFSDSQVEVAHAQHAADGGWDVRIVDGLGAAAGGGPRIALGDGGVMLAYPVVNMPARFATETADGGFAIQTIPSVANPQNVAVAMFQGTPHLVFDSSIGQMGQLLHATRAADEGFAVDPAVNAGAPPGSCAYRCFPAYVMGLAIDDAGGLHASFAEVDGTGTTNQSEVLLRYAYRPQGGAWTNEYVDGQGSSAGVANAIGVDPTGGVHVVYTLATANNTPSKLMHGYRCH